MVGKYKLADGTYRYFYKVYIRTTEGKEQVKKKEGFLRRKDASDAERELKTQVRLTNGSYQDKETVANFIRHYQTTKIEGRLAPSTVVRYESFKEDIVNYIGAEKIRTLTTLDIEGFYKRLKEDRELSSNTILKLHRYLRKAMDTAVRNNLIPANPADYVELEKNIKKEMNYWIAEDIKGNLEKLKGSFIYPIIFTAVNTGLRLGELLALTWDDVDLVNGYIKVNKSVYRLDKETKVKMHPKTKSGFRQVPLFPGALSYLKEYKLAQIPSIKRLVFHHNGEYWNPKNISKYFKEELIKYEVDIIRFHDLRHTYATLLLKSKVDDLIVSRTLGHSTVAFTKDTYGHMDDEYQKTEINKASKYL